MFVLVTVGYFSLAALIVSFVAFKDWRELVFSRIASGLGAGRGSVFNIYEIGVLVVGQVAAATVLAARHRFYWVANHLAFFCALCVLLSFPVAMVYWRGGDRIFEYADDDKGVDSKVALLLQGEALVPPQPLPPELFATKEIEMVRPGVVNASRNWEKLDEAFTQRLLLVFKIMKESYGYEMVLLEGYRSPERQAALYAQGPSVTGVGANRSYHQFGLAADSAFVRDGKVVISEKDPWAMQGYRLYGEVAEQVGLTWGGRWKLMDFGHVELRRKGVLAQQ